MVITSTSNEQVKKLIKLQNSSRFRREEGLFVCEGLRIISEIPKNRLVRVYCTDQFLSDHKEAIDSLDVSPVILSDRVFSHVCDTKSPQGILATAQMADQAMPSLDQDSLTLLVLEDVQNPGNLGAMLRTGEAGGVDAFIMTRGCADIYNPKVIRSSMGSFLRMPCIYTDNLEEVLENLHKQGISMYATHLEARHNCFDVVYPPKIALLIGNEGNGLSENVTKWASERIRIPMAGKVESLNASIAASVLIFEVFRQKLQSRA